MLDKILEKLPAKVKQSYEFQEDYKWSPVSISKENVSLCIDHTYLKIDANEDKIQNLCKEAIDCNFYAVCVQPVWLENAKAMLKDTNVKLASVANFPQGSLTYKNQLEEIKAIEPLADEIDYVQPFSLLLSKKYEEYFDHIKKIREAAKNKALKIILETSDLNEEEKIASGIMAVAAGFDFLKTSSGFAKGGATIEDVKLLRRIAGNKASVKASGGIRDYSSLKEMVEAGANRIGCSAGVRIVSR